MIGLSNDFLGGLNTLPMSDTVLNNFKSLNNITLPTYTRPTASYQLEALHDIKRQNGPYRSRFFRFFTPLRNYENIFNQDYLINHFSTLQENHTNIFKFITEKLTFKFSIGLLEFLDTVPRSQEDFRHGNFWNEIGCVLDFGSFGIKVLKFDLIYYSGYFIDQDGTDVFIPIHINNEFNSVIDDYDFISDKNIDISGWLSTALEEYSGKVFSSESNEFETWSDYCDKKGYDKEYNDPSSYIIQDDISLINIIKNIQDLEIYQKTNDRLIKNGCFAGFKCVIKTKIEDVNPDFILKDNVDDTIKVVLPKQVIVNKDKFIDLTDEQAYMLYLFLEYFERGQGVSPATFINICERNGKSDFTEKSEKAIYSMFERIQNSFEKTGYKSLLKHSKNLMTINKRYDR